MINKFCPIGKIVLVIGTYYKRETTLGDHWANCIDEYEVNLMDYCSLTMDLMRACDIGKVPKDLK